MIGHVLKEHGDGVHDASKIDCPETLIALEYRRGVMWPNGGGGGGSRLEGGCVGRGGKRVGGRGV